MPQTFKWYGDELLKRKAAAEERALRKGALFLLEEASKTIPFDKGDLEESADTDFTSVEIHARAAILGYVSNNPAKTVRQHEDMTYKHDPPRRAKWLELTMKEQAERVFEIMAEEYREAMA